MASNGSGASDLRRRDRIEVERDGETLDVYNWVTMERASRVRGNNPVVEHFEPCIFGGDSRMEPDAVTDWVARELIVEFDIDVTDHGIEVVDIEDNLDEVYY